MTYTQVHNSTPTHPHTRCNGVRFYTAVPKLLALLTCMTLIGCVTEQKQTLIDIRTPGPNASLVKQTSNLQVVLGNPTYFASIPSNSVITTFNQTYDDLVASKLIQPNQERWTVLWHHPASAEGRQLLAGTNRDPAMRGITFYKSRTIVLVGQPTFTSMARWMQIIRHETVHAMMYDTFHDQVLQWPWWLTEGLACLWEVPPIDGKPSHANTWRKPMLAYLRKSGQKILPSALITQMQPARNPDMLAKNYSRAWSLAYCLYQDYPDLLQTIMQTGDDAKLKSMIGDLDHSMQQLAF